MNCGFPIRDALQQQKIPEPLINIIEEYVPESALHVQDIKFTQKMAKIPSSIFTFGVWPSKCSNHFTKALKDSVNGKGLQSAINWSLKTVCHIDFTELAIEFRKKKAYKEYEYCLANIADSVFYQFDKLEKIVDDGLIDKRIFLIDNKYCKPFGKKFNRHKFKLDELTVEKVESLAIRFPYFLILDRIPQFELFNLIYNNEIKIFDLLLSGLKYCTDTSIFSDVTLCEIKACNKVTLTRMRNTHLPVFHGFNNGNLVDCAIKFEKYDILRVFVNHQLPIEQRNFNEALSEALKTFDYQIIEILAQSRSINFDKNIREKLYNHPDKTILKLFQSYKNPLTFPIQDNRIDAIKFLISDLQTKVSQTDVEQAYVSGFKEIFELISPFNTEPNFPKSFLERQAKEIERLEREEAAKELIRLKIKLITLLSNLLSKIYGGDERLQYHRFIYDYIGYHRPYTWKQALAIPALFDGAFGSNEEFIPPSVDSLIEQKKTRITEIEYNQKRNRLASKLADVLKFFLLYVKISFRIHKDRAEFTVTRVGEIFPPRYLFYENLKLYEDFLR